MSETLQRHFALYDTGPNGQLLLHAMPLLLGALCVIAIAYRYYSAFLAAKVAALDDSRRTPAHRFNDGQNYHPTNKWVLFGHHFAAISGAGPLIGPVLAIQYGYMPGLLWLVIGVCLAGAVQDMLVLAASVRRGGKSLAEIALAELGPWAYRVTSAAILFIVVIALAGLGFVVVKALGGEAVALGGKGMEIILPQGKHPELIEGRSDLHHSTYRFPEGCTIKYNHDDPGVERAESFEIVIPIVSDNPQPFTPVAGKIAPAADDSRVRPDGIRIWPGSYQVVKGSSWGTFTIAATIPIALFVGFYMYRLRKGRIIEASLIGGALVLAATVAGAWIPGSPLEGVFSLTKGQTVLAITVYGFIASVLPVWMLLVPRDYLSSFLKIGTVILLIAAVFVANPVLLSPMLNPVFQNGGPTFQGGIFPFVFICIMCGSISGFHALVSSGTTPKMVDKESHIRPIGYGAMLMEGIVGIVALIAAASLPPRLYYDINVGLDKAEKWAPAVAQVDREFSGAQDVAHLAVDAEKHDLAHVERMVGNESLRGRTGGAVTLAVGMSFVLSDALDWANNPATVAGLMKYWYHFAIMFEALFILTTIDAGTRIARFVLQEMLGKIHRPWERADSWFGAIVATGAVTAGWGLLVYTGSIDTIWPMFGIANQLLAVVALSVVTTLLVNTGRGRYAWVTLLPMLFVLSTTLTAAYQTGAYQFPAMIAGGQVLKGSLSMAMTVFVVTCVLTLLLLATARQLTVLRGVIPTRPEPTPEGEPKVALFGERKSINGGKADGDEIQSPPGVAPAP
ncbi:MAG TPA: carbon starvation CstA family protein [Gemmataceae bacterium]|nr:carbon starvation CstA family protein [Gemmataceae bacterium]